MNLWRACVRFVIPLGCGLAFAFAMVYSKWIEFPISKQLRGYQFSVLGYSPEPHGVIIYSFGVIAALVCLLGVVGFILRRRFVVVSASIALIWLSTWMILHVA